MTPHKRRQAIKKRMAAGSFTVYRIIKETGYTGFRSYLNGQDASDNNIYAVEQALTRLEAEKPSE